MATNRSKNVAILVSSKQRYDECCLALEASPPEGMRSFVAAYDWADFEELVRKFSGEFHALLVDREAARAHETQLRGFMAARPRMALAITPDDEDEEDIPPIGTLIDSPDPHHAWVRSVEEALRINRAEESASNN